jgi:hypothetical protein
LVIVLVVVVVSDAQPVPVHAIEASFLLVGFVWGKLLIRRRMQRPGGR